MLCIDEFAGLIGKPDFDKLFLSGLRAIAEDEGLVLITASRQPLHEVIEHIIGESSPLFNIMPQLTLKPFTEQEEGHLSRRKVGKQVLAKTNKVFSGMRCHTPAG